MEKKYWCCECGDFNIHSRKEKKCEICDAKEKDSPEADENMIKCLEDASLDLFLALTMADEILSQNEIYEDNPELNLAVSTALLRAQRKYVD